MKILAILLLIVGTIIGTLGGARLPTADWPITSIGLILLIISVGLFQVIRKGKSTTVTAGSGSNQETLDSLKKLPGELSVVEAELDKISLEELHTKLSELDLNYFRPISEAVPGLLGELGGHRFAEIFGVYSSGERSIARAWSATADRHREEALASFRSGTAKIKEAVAML